MTIRAAVLNAPKHRFVIEELDLDPPRRGEVLVKLAACGVCHSDWHIATGDTKHPMPVVAGHEGAGIVEAVGPDVADLRVGDHVVLSWAPSCGRCFYCLRNQPNLCDTYTAPIWAGTMLDGTTRLHRADKPVYSYCGTASFATHTVVPRQSCIVIRNDAPLDRACLIGCAVATGVGAAMFTAGVKDGESVVVFGCGGVGLNILQGAKLCGASTIIAVDVNDAKLAMALRFGATHAVPGTGNLPVSASSQHGQVAHATVEQQIRDLTGGRGADHAFEAVGIPSLQERALDAIRPGGTLTLAGLSPMGSTTNFPAAVLARQEKTVKGSYYGSVNPQRDFPMLLDLYMSGKLKLDELVSRRYTLEQINDAFADMLTGQAARGVITF
jgi:NDMA-dependent alcohol dehydrogenase